MRTPNNKKPIWAVDCESDPFLYGRVPVPFIWGVYEGYRGGYWQFEAVTPPNPSDEVMRAAAAKTIDEMMTFLRDQDVIAYAHNGGKFDWHFITRHLDPERSLLIISGRLAKFEIGKAEFRDSFNLMPISLDQYQKTPMEYWKMERAVRHHHAEEIRTYLKSDCVNLWNMVHGFEAEYGRHLTQASAAMKIWQARSKKRAPNSSQMFHDYFKPYYYGGRVQCFESGHFEVEAKGADIASAYPDAMNSKAHPIGLAYGVHSGEPSKAIDKCGHYFFKVRCVARGCFPYRTLNKALYFPADDVTREYTVTGWELITAIETRTVEKLDILEYVSIDEVTDFSDYVMHFWNKRKEAKAAGDKGRDYYCKIFLNGLYGKFASDPRNYKQYEIWPNDKLREAVDSGKDFDFFREWLLVSENIKRTKYRFYNLATAASITGAVRAKLWSAICQSKRPFYCDTDSITAVDFRGITLGKELGEWGIEGEYDDVVICGKKMYAFHFKGKPREDWLGKKYGRDGKPLPKNWKKATKGANLTAHDLIDIAKGNPVKFLPEVPTFSVHKQSPRFTPRIIKMTANDITVVPREIDPQYKRT